MWRPIKSKRKPPLTEVKGLQQPQATSALNNRFWPENNDSMGAFLPKVRSFQLYPM
jgi:hypothetical protein